MTADQIFAIIIFIGLGFIALVFLAMLVRWAFRINTIVSLLDSILTQLKTNSTEAKKLSAFAQTCADIDTALAQAVKEEAAPAHEVDVHCRMCGIEITGAFDQAYGVCENCWDKD